MKIDFFIIAFEAEKYLEACIKQILLHANKVIVVEGAVELMAKNKGYFRSKDNTVEILKKFSSIDIIQTNRAWKDKVEMKNAAIGLIESDIFWRVDYDEFYKHDDIENIRKAFEKDADLNIVTLQGYHFWKNYNQHRCGGKWECPNFRAFRNKGIIRYYQHNFPCRDNIPYKIKHFKSNFMGKLAYHYGYVETEQHIKDKVSFMAARDNHRVENYMSDLEEWRSGKISDNTAIKKFTGIHPEEIQKLIVKK